MAKLIIQEGENAGQEFELTARRLIIGSDPDNQIVLTDPGVEQAHASLEDRGERWILQDLGAPGGTSVNGVPIDGPCRLAGGDVIELGGVKLQIQGILPPTAPPTPTERLPDLSDAPPPVVPPQVVIPAPNELTQRRSGFPVLAVVGGGVLAVVAIAIVTAVLAGGVWWYRSASVAESSDGANADQVPENIPPDVGTAAPLSGQQLTPVLILLQPRSPELTISPGQEVLIRSRTQDATGVERVELWVDGVLVTTTFAEGEATTEFVAEQRWTSAETGSYRLDVVAYNQVDLPSNVGSFLVTVVGSEAEGLASPVAAPETPTLPGQLAISFFRCKPACEVEQGGSLLLEWEVQGASQVYLDGAEVEMVGSLSITPTTAITPELWALTGTEEVSQTLAIGVR